MNDAVKGLMNEIDFCHMTSAKSGRGKTSELLWNQVPSREV